MLTYVKKVNVHMALYGLETHHRATERHLPHGITQCYLPPDTGKCTPALTPAMQAGTQFTYPEGMEG